MHVVDLDLVPIVLVTHDVVEHRQLVARDELLVATAAPTELERQDGVPGQGVGLGSGSVVSGKG